MPIEFVKSAQDFQAYLQNNKYLVANFTALWCGPCQAIKPLIDELYQKPEFSQIEVVRIDLDSQQALASQYNISSVPTFIFFVDGTITETVKGASLKIQESFDKLRVKAQLDPLATRAGNGAQPAPAVLDESVTLLIPTGYLVLNQHVFYGEFEALNAKSLAESSAVKEVFDLAKENTGIFSDIDSQLLVYVPLTHISKVYSILIKTSKPSEGVLDEEELEECQYPNLVKIWANKMGIISFDDATSDNSAPHIEKLSLGDGWYECRLKYVRFQKVQSLNLFFDGEDDDFHTVIEKIVIVGVGGEEKDQAFDKLKGDEHD